MGAMGAGAPTDPRLAPAPVAALRPLLRLGELARSFDAVTPQRCEGRHGSSWSGQGGRRLSGLRAPSAPCRLWACGWQGAALRDGLIERLRRPARRKPRNVVCGWSVFLDVHRYRLITEERFDLGPLVSPRIEFVAGETVVGALGDRYELVRVVESENQDVRGYLVVRRL